MSFWDKTVNGSILALGIILIVAALSIALWISKPYITFLFSASKTEALEEKARLFEQVRSDVMKGAMQYAEDTRKRNERLQGRLWQSAELTGRKNWIIFPNAIVDAPIIEGVSEDKLSEGVCHIPESAAPGEGGNCIIIGHNLGDFFEWSWPSGPFHMLEATEKGQLIYIFYSGKKYIYKVKEKTYRNANDPTLYDFSPRERLTLITCAASSDPTVYANTRVVITAYPQ